MRRTSDRQETTLGETQTSTFGNEPMVNVQNNRREQTTHTDKTERGRRSASGAFVRS